MEPNQTQTPETQVAPSHRSFGPIIGIGVIIIALIVGALYFWGGAITKNDEAGLAPLSSSDDLDSIESDLMMSTDLEFDFSDIEKELAE
ncbi:MAG: hypothetical protein Q8L64_06655 [bacterium]|nr:hypothetical protein [bacterium]